MKEGALGRARSIATLARTSSWRTRLSVWRRVLLERTWTTTCAGPAPLSVLTATRTRVLHVCREQLSSAMVHAPTPANLSPSSPSMGLASPATTRAWSALDRRRTPALSVRSSSSWRRAAARCRRRASQASTLTDVRSSVVSVTRRVQSVWGKGHRSAPPVSLASGWRTGCAALSTQTAESAPRASITMAWRRGVWLAPLGVPSALITSHARHVTRATSFAWNGSERARWRSHPVSLSVPRVSMEIQTPSPANLAPPTARPALATTCVPPVP